MAYDNQDMNRFPHRFVRAACLVSSLALLTAACGGDDDVASSAATTTEPASASVAITSPADGTVVKGNVVTLALKVTGITIVAADGDTSGKTGHIHAFIDREPVAVGAAIPKEAGVVHSVDNPLRLTGLTVGKHVIKVVLGDGTHTRITGAADQISVTVEGPSVDATAPPIVKTGSPVRIDFKVTGLQIVKADGDASGATGHFHVFVDKPLPAPGELIPKPDDGSIIHTAESFVEIPNLPAGEHVFFVVLGDGTHTALNPMVADRVAVTVG